MAEYLLHHLGPDPSNQYHQLFTTELQHLVDSGIPAYVPDAISSIKRICWWGEPGTGLTITIVNQFDWSEIESNYEYYSDLTEWTAYQETANSFIVIDSPNGWRAQADDALSSVCIATTELTQPISELHQTVAMNAQTIGLTARSFLGQGDLLASLSGTVKVNNSAIIATMGLDCLDNAGIVLETARTLNPPTSGQWYRVAASFALPPNTARVRLRLMCDKSGAPAVSHNAVFGDLSLTFTHRQVYYGNLRA
jgi:hypothetical protein